MIQSILVSGLALILTYLTWVWGGLRVAWLPPASWASCSLLVILLASAWMPDRLAASRSCPLWRDAFFYFGLLFLGYLAIQWWNAGRVLYFDVGFSEWRYSQPRHAGWPSAFSRAEAVQMLYWFFPAWVLGLTVRSPAVSRGAVSGLLQVLVYGAGLLSILGIVQFLTRTRLQYWLAPTGDGFFASFGYTNHAAAYFVLMGSVAAGLLFRGIFTGGGALRTATGHGKRQAQDIATHSAPSTGSRHLYRTVALAVSLVLCLVGANLSLSRAGVILAWALAGFVAVYGLVKGWRRLRVVSRLNLVVATIAVLCIFYFAVAGFGKKEILREFEVKKPIHHRLCPALDKVNLALSDRPLLDAVALQMWRDNPVYGVGGWGFSHLLALYLPAEKWNYVQYPGRANVHCDILQFLAEFGVIGFGLMLSAVTSLILSLFPPPFIFSVALAKEARERARVRVHATRRDPLWIMGIIGLSLVLIFSLIDLPFRCPAILCTWVVVLAALPIATEVRIQESETVTDNQ